MDGSEDHRREDPEDYEIEDVIAGLDRRGTTCEVAVENEEIAHFRLQDWKRRGRAIQRAGAGSSGQAQGEERRTNCEME